MQTATWKQRGDCTYRPGCNLRRTPAHRVSTRRACLLHLERDVGVVRDALSALPLPLPTSAPLSFVPALHSSPPPRTALSFSYGGIRGASVKGRQSGVVCVKCCKFIMISGKP